MGRLSPAAHDLLNLSLPDETVYHQDQGLLLGIGQAVDLLVEGQQFLVVNPGLGGSGRSPGEFIERDLEDVGDAHHGIELRRSQATLPAVIDTGVDFEQFSQPCLGDLSGGAQQANPFADQLTFQSDKTRMRRDHEKYLTLIDTIALLHQHQREVKTVRHAGTDLAYIEVTLADIECANRLVHEVLGRSLDELPPVTRRVNSST